MIIAGASAKICQNQSLVFVLHILVINEAGAGDILRKSTRINLSIAFTITRSNTVSIP